MKGVLLAGGLGTRLMPLTKVTNKHLLPVYNKPMIYYPLQKMVDAGLKDILIVTGPEHSGHFIELLEDGSEFGVHITYAVQENPLGIAQAISYAEEYSQGESIAVILGDNIFEDKLDFSDFKHGARIYLKELSDRQKFGVPCFKADKIVRIDEKPDKPQSKYAVTGVYLYDNQVFDVINKLKPSARGEFEITDVNNHYITKNQMDYRFLKGFWTDAGSFKTLLTASNYIHQKEGHQHDPIETY